LQSPYEPVLEFVKLPLTEDASKGLEARYLHRDGGGRIVETPEQLFQRVARCVAAAEETFGGQKAARQFGYCKY
jgi:ribonucleotide reductase alpha subunit